MYVYIDNYEYIIKISFVSNNFIKTTNQYLAS